MKKFFCFLLLVSLPAARAQGTKPPVRLALFGLVHDHASGFFALKREHPEIEVVGIVEPNHALVVSYAKRFNFDENIACNTLDELLARTNVDAVAAFTTTLDHRRVVELCAAHHLPVMMEKPMAVNMREAKAIRTAAKTSGIPVVINFETTWYPANQAARKMVDDGAIGDLRKVVVHDGHRGPKEIGCSTTFLSWLTDPVQNGGGALPDFGCYGADLITWLMHGQRPVAVTCVTQHMKPDVYPKVEDEATIILTYPKTQGILQASWNWPISRKDMELYGTKGQLLVPHRDELRMQKLKSGETEQKFEALPLSDPNRDQLSYLAAVVRREIKPDGLSSIEMNMTVTEILDAARQSARTRRMVAFPPFAP